MARKKMTFNNQKTNVAKSKRDTDGGFRMVNPGVGPDEPTPIDVVKLGKGNEKQKFRQDITPRQMQQYLRGVKAQTGDARWTGLTNNEKTNALWVYIKKVQVTHDRVARSIHPKLEVLTVAADKHINKIPKKELDKIAKTFLSKTLVSISPGNTIQFAPDSEFITQILETFPTDTNESFIESLNSYISVLATVDKRVDHDDVEQQINNGISTQGLTTMVDHVSNNLTDAYKQNSLGNLTARIVNLFYRTVTIRPRTTNLIHDTYTDDTVANQVPDVETTQESVEEGTPYTGSDGEGWSDSDSEEEEEGVSVDWKKAVLHGFFSQNEIDTSATKCQRAAWNIYRSERGRWNNDETKKQFIDSGDIDAQEWNKIVTEIDMRWLGIIENQKCNTDTDTEKKKQTWDAMVQTVDERRISRFAITPMKSSDEEVPEVENTSSYTYVTVMHQLSSLEDSNQMSPSQGVCHLCKEQANFKTIGGSNEVVMLCMGCFIGVDDDLDDIE